MGARKDACTTDTSSKPQNLSQPLACHSLALRLHVFKPLQVQDEACGRLLDEQPLLRFLQAAAVVAEELVILVQHLGRAGGQAMRRETGAGAGQEGHVLQAV